MSLKYPVKLHLYDLSNGMARAMSMAIIGKQLDGIWHSGIVVYGVEYFYGGGICAAPAGHAIPHLPYQEILLGETTKSQVELEMFLQSVNLRFTQATYSLLRHNCNNFANEVAQFLLQGQGIPEHIIRLPQEFLSSPLGATFAPMIEQMENRMRAEVLGGDGGLNPFAHIRGRTLLFENPTTDDVGGLITIPTDTALLKTAVDGIPVSVMPVGVKKGILESDPTFVKQLSEIICSKFNRDKKPVVLSFGTIARTWVKVAEFRNTVQDVLAQIVDTAIHSDDTHVVSTGLAVLANWTGYVLDGAEYEECLQSIVEDVFLPGDFSSSKHVAFVTVILNNALVHDLPNIQVFVHAIKHLIQHFGDENAVNVPALARALEKAAKLLLDNDARIDLEHENIDVAEVVSLTEFMTSKANVNMERTLEFMLQ